MSVARALRALPLGAPQGALSALAPPSRLSATLAILAVVLQLTVSSNLLTMFGIAYSMDGGNPAVKFHPGTYLAVFALLARMFESGRPIRTLEQLASTFPLVATFLGMIGLCIVWVVVNTGISGVAAYVESYFSAGVLFLVLADMSVAQRRVLGWTMLLLFVGNAALATGETVVRHNLLPLYLSEGKIYKDVAYEFRGLALYDHALTGGMMTQMALFLLVSMRLSPRLTIGFALPLLVGLISFGGRTSLIVCALTMLLLGGFVMLRGLLDRSLRPVVILAAIIGVVAVAGLLFFLVTETSIGIRLAGKLSFNDDSTATRSVQWLMPGLMTWSEFLFGISAARELEYIYQLGLTYHFEIVENFWLVALMNLGLLGFVCYLAGFFAFLAHLWRFARPLGRAILVTTILVASTSNSLGRKSNVLFVMTACIVATTGFARARAGASSRVIAATISPTAMATAGAGGLRSLRAAASRQPDDDAEAVADQGSSTGPGGLRRSPPPSDRALRPLRLTAART